MLIDIELSCVWISFENIPLPMFIDYTKRKRKRKMMETEEVKMAKEERAQATQNRKQAEKARKMHSSPY
jgi:hypothetical protein